MSLSSLLPEPTLLINNRVFLDFFHVIFKNSALTDLMVFQFFSFSTYNFCGLSNISSLFQVVFTHSFSAYNMHVWKDFFKNSSSLFTGRRKNLFYLCLIVQGYFKPFSCRFQAIIMPLSSLFSEPSTLIIKRVF